jgi:DNA-binding transcriptional regulator YdaS (Cro superfamily)
MDALTRAIEIAGGVGALAEKINVKQPVVSNWRARGGRVPADHCSAVELATGGAVKRWHLRPDDWHRIWPELIGVDGAPGLCHERVGVHAA